MDFLQGPKRARPFVQVTDISQKREKNTGFILPDQCMARLMHIMRPNEAFLFININKKTKQLPQDPYVTTYFTCYFHKSYNYIKGKAFGSGH